MFSDMSIIVAWGEIMKKMLVLMWIVMLNATFGYAASGDLWVGGNLGVGTTSPGEKLDVSGNAKIQNNLAILGSSADSRYGIYAYKAFADPALAKGLCFLLYPTWTSSDQVAKYFIGIDSVPSPIITTAQNNPGYVYGVRSTVLRNANALDSDDNGGLSELAGMYVAYGHYSTNSTAAPGTSTAYGLRINPYYKKGTIDSMYDIYLGASITGGTVTNRWGIYQANSANNRFGGNVGIGTTNMGTGGAGALLFGGGTKPSNLSGVAGFYASSASGVTELFAFDSTGDATKISPHAIDAPDWMYDADDGVPMIVKEIQQFVGYVRYTNLTRQARLASMTDAEKSAFPRQRRTCVFKESFADHNARLALTGKDALVQLDWDTEQQAVKEARDAERLSALKAQAAQQAAKTMAAARGATAGGEGIEPEAPVQVPEEYVIQPMPTRLRAAMDAARRN